MWYKDNKPIKNPVKLVIDGKEIIAYITAEKLADKNNQVLIDNGYVWIEPPAPPAPIKKYSRYKIYCKLNELGQWDSIIAALEENKELYWQFMLAEYLKEDNPAFVAFLQVVPEELKQYLDECLWDED